MSTETPPEGDPKDAFTPPASQADLDRIVSERLARERAKYADYDDLKAKAARLDEIEESNKSALEKEREAREAAEKERDALKAAAQLSAWKAEVAETTGVDPSLLAGSTKEELEAHAAKLAAFIEQKKPGYVLPREGTEPRSDGSEAGGFVRDLFG